MAKNLLIEIGTEELPSSSMNEAVRSFKHILEEGLKNGRIGFINVSTAATPRRLAAFVKSLDDRQKTEEKIISGPPKKISFDENGNPTDAATGFAKGLGVSVWDLIDVDTGKGTYLGYKSTEQGKATAEVLPDIIKSSIIAISFAKQMTWGDYSIRFARPIRWIAALYGDETVSFKIENIQSSDVTFGLRNSSPQLLKIPAPDSMEDYFDFLEKNASVILDPAKRKQMILGMIERVEKEKWSGRFKAILDKDLLEEVVNLVEIPNVLIGTFPQQYLYIPKEILIKAIQHHQRYFAVLDETGKVTTNFIIIQNGISDEKGEIAKGNERVLRARLSDATFFYEEDRKSNFDIWIEKLKGVIFYSGVGSLYDKSCRLEKICGMIAASLLEKMEPGSLGFQVENLKRAGMICKCDLVTNLVVEFPELQGLVGREYAGEKGEAADVAESVFEHYLPRFAGDILPYTITGAILSIADKFDTITGMFMTENVPSGSQDPFALRRKASGIVLTCLDKNFDLDLNSIAGFCIGLFADTFDFKNLDRNILSGNIVDFISARYRFRLEKNNKRVDIFDAVISAGFSSITDIDLRFAALDKYLNEGNEISRLSEPLTRCKNIIKGMESGPVIDSLLSEEAELALFRQLGAKEDNTKKLTGSNRYYEATKELVDFADVVNLFFDSVLVMDKDETVRRNRINLIKRCTELYLKIADFSRIAQT